MTKDTSVQPPIESDSVPPAIPRYRLGALLDGQEVKHTDVKCTKCELKAQHDYLMVLPVDSLGIESQMDLAPKAKRLTLCTNCGEIRLIK